MTSTREHDKAVPKYLVAPVVTAAVVTIIAAALIGLSLRTGPSEVDTDPDVAGLASADPADPHAAVASDALGDEGAVTSLILTAERTPEAAAAATAAVLATAPTVVLADTSLGDVVEIAENAAAELRVPLLLTEGDALSPPTAAELERLEPDTVLTVGATPPLSGVDQIVIPVAGQIPSQAREAAPQELATPAALGLLPDNDIVSPAALALRALGAAIVPNVADGDPRRSDEIIASMRDVDPTSVIGIGDAFGSLEQFENRITTALTADSLPGGGQLIFGNKMYVALYGTPGTASLGLLGEQDLEAAIVRAKEYAAQYEPLVDREIVPAFEIITTVASGVATDDGDYSYGVDPAVVKEWIERAGEEGLYVVLDLQPGRSDFLTQAKQYEDLLSYPHVGLALDPEWRLKPNQVHLRQIGSVGIDEVNSVHDYLTALVREKQLPQKMLILHQFKSSMLADRERLAEPTDEVAVAIHVDGQGPPGAKIGTWNSIREDAPPVAWGWKNFIDEDAPMLTPEQTIERVDPQPDLITYQ